MSNLEIAEPSPSPIIPKLEQLIGLEQKAINQVSKVLSKRLKAPNTLATPEMKKQEDSILAERGVELKDPEKPDRLWETLHVLYPENTAQAAYSIIRQAQVVADGGNIPPGWQSDTIHKELLEQYADFIDEHDQKRQILVGKGAVLPMLQKVLDEMKPGGLFRGFFHRAKPAQVQPAEAAPEVAVEDSGLEERRRSIILDFAYKYMFPTDEDIKKFNQHMSETKARNRAEELINRWIEFHKGDTETALNNVPADPGQVQAALDKYYQTSPEQEPETESAKIIIDLGEPDETLALKFLSTIEDDKSKLAAVTFVQNQIVTQAKQASGLFRYPFLLRPQSAEGELIEQDKMELAFFRQVARDLKYEIGEFRYNKATGEITVPITKIQPEKTPAISREPESTADIEDKPLVPKGAERAGLQIYDKPMQDVFGSAREIGFGAFSHAYVPEKHPGIVIKVFDGFTLPPDDFSRQIEILSQLNGSEHVVRLLGYSQPGSLPSGSEYLVEERIDGEDLTKSFFFSPPFPLNAAEAGSNSELETHKKLAAWCVSSLEALAEIHGKGLAVGDFRFNDFLWDTERKKAVLVDLGNAISLKTSPWAMKDDIQYILAAFFGKTQIGLRLGMLPDIIGQTGYPWPPDKNDNCTPKTIELLRTTAQKLAAPDSLMKIIGLLEEDTNKPEGDYNFHSAREYADALKTYFQEVGLLRQ